MTKALDSMSIRIDDMVAGKKGYELRAMLDAAQDVAKHSDRRELQRTAQAIVSAARTSHPEYFDPTLKGVC